MKNFKKILLENQQELLRLGLFPQDLEPQNFTYLMMHGNFPDGHFSFDHCSPDQAIYLINFIYKNWDSNKDSTVDALLVGKLYNEIVASYPGSILVITIQNEDIIKERLLSKWIRECEYFIWLISESNEEFNKQKIRDIVINAVEIFQVSFLLEFNNQPILDELKSELRLAFKNLEKFHSKFRNEYYALGNITRNDSLGELLS